MAELSIPERQVENYTVLPLRLPNPPSLPPSFQPATHYLYLRPHAAELRHWVPDLPESDIPRSLYVSNIPFDATETNLRQLFSEHLGGSRIERVEFCAGDIIHGAYAATTSQRTRAGQEQQVEIAGANGHGSRGKKRKRRAGREELEALEAQLPGVEDEPLLLRSGSCAVLVFVDRASAKLALQTCQKVAREVRKKKNGEPSIEWNSGRTFGRDCERSETGLCEVDFTNHELDYKTRYQRQFPPRENLLRSVNEYLARYDALEDVRKRALTRARTIPDADGFLTVTRGGRVGPARIEEAKEALKKQQEREKKNSAENFYRFQFREKAKEKERELKRKFEQDVRDVQKLRDKRKGKSWAL